MSIETEKSLEKACNCCGKKVDVGHVLCFEPNLLL